MDFVDTDGFDAVFESTLVARDAAIVVRTGRTQPDWGPRLNAWIAAWNQGGSARPRTVRGQAGPVPGVNLDKDTLREFRLLVNDLLDRVEGAAEAGSSWWTDRRERARRVALLKSYNLRFHLDGEGLIQLVFFHGDRAAAYPSFMQTLMGSPAEPWARSVQCSRCLGWAEGKLTGRVP